MIGNNIENKLKQLAKKILGDDHIKIRRDIKVFIPEKIEYGDFSSNILFLFAKILKENPQNIFEKYKNDFYKSIPFAERLEIKGGYLNIFVNKQMLFNFYKNILLKKFEVLKNNLGKKQKFIIEYVSANPTGPLHIGNARGAILGDILTNLFKLCNFRVTKEYYVNDRGRQVNILINTILYNLGLKEYSEEYYKGDYVKEIANFFEDKIDRLSQEKLRKFVVSYVLKNYIKISLNKFGTRFDNFYFESDLYKENLDDKILNILKKNNLIEEKEGAIWLKLTKIGEFKDEVLIKKDKEPTYFFSDILYNYEKLFIRKYKYSLIIVASDHQDHVRRLSAVFEKIFNVKPKNFQFLVYQMVHLQKENEILKMSKRKGTFISLDDILNMVEAPALRFYFAKYSPENTIEVDLDLLKKESEENPIWYTLYTYARFRGIIKKAKEQKFLLNRNSIKTNLNKSFNYIKDKEDYLKILRIFIQFSQLIPESAISLRPNIIFQAFLNLCKELNSFYEKVRILENDDNTKSRLLFVVCVINFLEFLFNIFGINPQKHLSKFQNDNRDKKS